MNYKRNHYIPISLINSWVIQNKKGNGVFVYNIHKKKKFFCSAKDKRKFSFAIKNNLYVPEINQIRFTGVERWLSSQEVQLSRFLKKLNKLKNKEVYEVYNAPKKFSLSIQALIGLEYRSRIAINKIKEFLITNPIYQKKISANDCLNIDKTVLENLIHVITNQTHKIMPAQLLVFQLSKSELILCDQPVIDIDDLKCYVAGRRLLIYIKRSNEGVSNIVFRKKDINIINTVNHQLALQARDWIVASNELILEKYILVINSEEYKQNLKKDKIELLIPKHLNTGYSIID